MIAGAGIDEGSSWPGLLLGAGERARETARDRLSRPSGRGGQIQIGHGSRKSTQRAGGAGAGRGRNRKPEPSRSGPHGACQPVPEARSVGPVRTVSSLFHWFLHIFCYTWYFLDLRSATRLLTRELCHTRASPTKSVHLCFCESYAKWQRGREGLHHIFFLKLQVSFVGSHWAKST
jgi:hypothetical protein